MVSKLLFEQGCCNDSLRAKSVDLFVLAGQSNMQGSRGNAEYYPADLNKFDAQIGFYWVAAGLSSSEGEWTHLQPQGGIFPQGHFGPEVTFARELAQDGLRPAIFKYTVGSSSLAEKWLAPGKQGMYDDMVKELQKAIALLEEAGNKVTVKALVWIQGESDSQTDEMALNYYARLEDMIDDFRGNVIKNPQLPIILGVDDQCLMDGPNGIRIILSQKKMAFTKSGVVSTSMIGLPKFDNTHLTPSGLEDHGRLLHKVFYEAEKKVQAKPDIRGNNLNMGQYSGNRPLLSICIPTFNRAEILRKTLEHLHQVCDADVEVVVTDNASPDHTQQVIEEFRPKFRFYRTLRHSQNLGVAKNGSSALSLATGKYIYALSDDDAIYYDSLKSAIRLMEAEPEIVGVYGSYQEWDRNTDRILKTKRFVETRTDFIRGDKLSIFNRFEVLWLPICRAYIYQRYFNYDDNTFGMWPLVGTLLENGNVAIIPEIFYKHANTVPRMEFELTESWYHDSHRAQYEVYVGRLGSSNPQEFANFVNSRVGPAYIQGARFAAQKNQMLKARHFMLRARAYGFVDEAAVMQWERESLTPMIAEKLLRQIELLPHVREVLFERTPKLESVKAQFASIAENYQIGSVEVNEWQNSAVKPDQFLVTYMYNSNLCGKDGKELLSLDPSRYRAVLDIIESCRLTNQPLQL